MTDAARREREEGWEGAGVQKEIESSLASVRERERERETSTRQGGEENRGQSAASLLTHRLRWREERMRDCGGRRGQ